MKSQRLSNLKRKPSKVLTDFDESLRVTLKKKDSAASNESNRKISLKTISQTIVNIQKNNAASFDDRESIISLSPPILNENKPPSLLKSWNKFITALSMNLPFETTSVMNLSMLIYVNINQKRIAMEYYDYETILTVKIKLEKSIVISASSFALFHPEGRRLESFEILSLLKLPTGSTLNLVEQKKQKIKVKFESNNKNYLLEFFSSETVSHIKIKIGRKIQTKPENFSIKLFQNYEQSREFELLDDNRDIFHYNILTETAVFLVTIMEEINIPDTVFMDENNNQIPKMFTEQFIMMTEKLNICECHEIRIQAISDIMCKVDVEENIKILRCFTPNYHHKRCAKGDIHRKSSSVSFFSEYESSDSEESSSVSIEKYIDAECDRYNHNNRICLTDNDYNYLCKTGNFKSFKRYLRVKIGTICNLRNVALLYMAARGLINYIDGMQDNMKDKHLTKRMTNYIILYFRKYFEKTIISKGGLAALTLSESDVD